MHKLDLGVVLWLLCFATWILDVGCRAVGFIVIIVNFANATVRVWFLCLNVRASKFSIFC